MSKSTTAALCAACFILGTLTGLLWAAFKGPPPGLEAAAPSPTRQSDAAPSPPKDISRELAELERKIKESPDNPQYPAEAANLLFDNEQYAESIKYYEAALKISADNPNILTDAGIAYRRLGRPEVAVKYFRRAQDLDPDHLNSLYNLGVVFFHDLQDPKAALEAWQRYLALDPSGSRADRLRRVIRQIQGSPE